MPAVVRVSRRRPAATSHSLMTPLKSADATVLPSGVTATNAMAQSCPRRATRSARVATSQTRQVVRPGHERLAVRGNGEVSDVVGVPADDGDLPRRGD